MNVFGRIVSDNTVGKGKDAIADGDDEAEFDKAMLIDVVCDGINKAYESFEMWAQVATGILKAVEAEKYGDSRVEEAYLKRPWILSDKEILKRKDEDAKDRAAEGQQQVESEAGLSQHQDSAGVA